MERGTRPVRDPRRSEGQRPSRAARSDEVERHLIARDDDHDGVPRALDGGRVLDARCAGQVVDRGTGG